MSVLIRLSSLKIIYKISTEDICIFFRLNPVALHIAEHWQPSRERMGRASGGIRRLLIIMAIKQPKGAPSGHPCRRTGNETMAI